MSIEQPGLFHADWQNAPDLTDEEVTLSSEREPSFEAKVVQDISDTLSSLRGRQYLLIAPGSEYETSTKPHRFETALLVSTEELILRNGGRSYHCALPNAHPSKRSGRPVVQKLAATLIHTRPYGPRHKPERFIYALDAHEVVIGRLDDSDTWEMRLDQVGALCAAIDLEFERRVFEDEAEVLRLAPNLAEPKLEYAVEHRHQEIARQWTQGIWLVMALAAGFSAAGMWLVLASPLGPWYRGLLAAAAFASGVLTLWSRSVRRMRRSMRKAGFESP